MFLQSQRNKNYEIMNKQRIIKISWKFIKIEVNYRWQLTSILSDIIRYNSIELLQSTQLFSTVESEKHEMERCQGYVYARATRVLSTSPCKSPLLSLLKAIRVKSGAYLHAIKGVEIEDRTPVRTIQLRYPLRTIGKKKKKKRRRKKKKKRKIGKKKNYITVHTVELITYLSSKTHSAGAASITLSLISITLPGELQSEWKLK